MEVLMGLNSLLELQIHTVWSQPQERWVLSTINEKFKDFVNWVLMFQNCSLDILKFRLRCLNLSDDDHTLQRWMSVVARRNVKQLYLKLISHTPIQLPHCLVTCQSLVALELKFKIKLCVVKLPIYTGFCRLKSLDLEMIRFLDSNLLGNFISSCHVMESLKIISCVFGDFKILEISSTSLKNLIVDSGDTPESNSDGLANCEVKVACPSLVSFNFITSSTWNFTFQDLNSLQDVFVYYDYSPDQSTSEECHYVMSKVLKGLRNVQRLKLSTGFLTMEWDECWEIPDKVTCSTYHLKSVRLLDFGGSENELELVRFLLKKGQVLEKLSITWLRGEENRREIIREIKKFPTSSNVAFTFYNPASFFYGLLFLDYDHDL
ncbi:hypothetical protein Q3G72_017221 [Acer saccharum]|nr:hypothetical protein Q3G72_017221 [Acer saccharum]